MHKIRSKFAMPFLCALLLVLLPACAQVKKAHFLPPLSHPENAHPAPVGFSGVRMKLPAGYDAGGISELNRSFFCLWPYYTAGRGDVGSVISQGDLKDIFKDTLEGQGYDITGIDGFEFEEDFFDEALRSEYRVGARIVGADMAACTTDPDLIDWILGLRDGVRGEFHVIIEWTVFDALHRETVYKATTEGYAKRRQSNKEGLIMLLGESFGMAAHNFAADPHFRDLIFFGKKPEGAWQKRASHEDRPRKFDPREEVAIANTSLSSIPFSRHADSARKVAVMVQAGAGHGSGFFITKQGHILTNAHVVGDALRVRVVTADKEEAITAEVLRKDKARDAALLKLEEIPENIDITVLPLRTEWPGVGEPVYSVGAPVMARLQDSVRAGIISAHRKGFKANGTKQDLIQADVATQGGNSGGPLLDGNGNIVGFAHAGFDNLGNDMSLNLFVPIGEALRVMDIALD